jgi:hypothetical protein
MERLRADLESGRWAERNRDLAGLEEAELGAWLLIAAGPSRKDAGSGPTPRWMRAR